nr:response regulator [Candidatus Competibacteraceae bacterium]
MTDQPMVEERKIYYERILIIDDEEITRMMLRRVLEESGYWVLEATNGQQGLQTCLLENPDAVLMDVRMPVMNGFEACQAIRQEPAISRVPILMLTSLDDVVAVQLAFDAGATDFVTKPINWALLAQRVRYALRAREIERQMRENEEQLARAQRIARLGYWRYEIAVDWLNLSLELCHLLEIDTVRGMTGSEMREHVLEEDLPLLERFIAAFLQ